METTSAADTPLKRWRVAQGLSSKDAADKLNVTLPMYSRWETADRDIPPLRVLDIETITGIPRHELRPDVFGEAA